MSMYECKLLQSRRVVPVATFHLWHLHRISLADSFSSPFLSRVVSHNRRARITKPGNVHRTHNQHETTMHDETIYRQLSSSSFSALSHYLSHLDVPPRSGRGRELAFVQLSRSDVLKPRRCSICIPQAYPAQQRKTFSFIYLDSAGAPPT